MNLRDMLGGVLGLKQTQDAAQNGAFTPGSQVPGLTYNSAGSGGKIDLNGGGGRLRMNPTNSDFQAGLTNGGLSGSVPGMTLNSPGQVPQNNGTLRMNPTNADFQQGLLNGGLSGSVPGLSLDSRGSSLADILKRLLGR